MNDLILLDPSTGRQRVAYQSSDGDLLCQYSSKEPKVFCTATGRDAGNKTDLFSVDDKTGAVEKIASLQGSKALFRKPDDGGTFYFFDLSDDKSGQITSWDLNTQQEIIVVPGAQDGEALSFDGRWLLCTVDGDSLSVRPVSGGDWKVLVSGVKGLWTDMETTHDGNWAFYSRTTRQANPLCFACQQQEGCPNVLEVFRTRRFGAKNLP